MTGGGRVAATDEMAPPLGVLARRHGVETEYVDAFGTRRTPSTDALLAVLRSLGVPIAAPSDAATLLERAPQRSELPPVAVGWDGIVEPLEVGAPPGGGHVRCTLDGEDGGSRVWDARPSADGTVRVQVPGRLEPGCHRLVVEAGSRLREIHVIAAPSRAFVTGHRRRGAFLPLYALNSRLSWGAGNFGDLGEFAAWLSGLGAGVVGTLPLLAAFLDEPSEPSPYSPVSRLFWNELYVEVEAVHDVEGSAEARRRLAGAAEAVAELASRPTVDHVAQAALARSVLEAALADLSPPRRETFDAFRTARRPDADEYARFRATGERHGRDWRAWPAGAAGDPRAAEYHAYVQWVAADQVGHLSRTLRAHGVDLFLDLPVGAHPHGYDRWRFRSSFADGAATGAPPDAFFSEGQNWGLAPLHPAGSRATGHDYFRRCLAFQMEAADVLRIDHVMGLHRSFWVPDGFPPTEGVYVRNPAEELYALVCLESHRHRCRVVGEDLGTVPEEVRVEMARRRVGRTVVVQFELPDEPDAPLAEPPAGALATVNTHDTPPFLRFWEGGDVDDRVGMGLLDEHEAVEERERRRRQREATVRFLDDRGLVTSGDAGDVLTGLLAWLGSGPAGMAVANVEDLWLEREPQNVPGTTEGNWCRRVPQPLEEWTGRREVHQRLLALVRGSRGDGGDPQ